MHITSHAVHVVARGYPQAVDFAYARGSARGSALGARGSAQHIDFTSARGLLVLHVTRPHTPHGAIAPLWAGLAPIGPRSDPADRNLGWKAK
jgi:hypothetical protein